MPTRGQCIILCALALLTIGVVMVNSAGMSVTPVLDARGEPYGAGRVAPSTPWGFADIATGRPAVYMLLALAAMAFAAMLPIGRLARLARAAAWARPRVPLIGLLAGGLVMLGLLLAVYVPGLAAPENGASRWIRLPGVGTAQPSELVKWGAVWLLAWYAVAAGERLRRFVPGLLPALAVLGVLSFAIVVEDLGTGVLVAAAGSAVLLAAGARLAHFALFIPPALAGIAAAIVTSPYRVRRVVAFLNPYADPEGDGYHMIQSMAAIADGGLTGRGLGHGIRKFGYLPEDTTDFVFAVICEELGLAGALVVCSLYAALVVALLGVVRSQRDPLVRLGVLGVLVTLSFQAAMNLVVVTGLGPTKGIALPLLSRGGTGWLLTAASLGLAIAADRLARRRGPAAHWAADPASEPAPHPEPPPEDDPTPAHHPEPPGQTAGPAGGFDDDGHGAPDDLGGWLFPPGAARA